MARDHRGDFGSYIGIEREFIPKGQRPTGTTMGAAAGVTQTEYSNWETGKTIPQKEQQVRDVAAKLGLPPDKLVTIWKNDRKARRKNGDQIVTRTYNVTSVGGGTNQDAY